jgi:hypothetical protein
MNKHTIFLGAAVAILTGAGVNELGRIVQRAPWPHVVAPYQSYVIGALFASVWLATAASLLLRRRSDSWFSIALLGSFFSVILMFAHGAVLRLLGNPGLILFAPLAVVLAICIKKNFDETELSAFRERMTRRPHPRA